jgi:valyl-tRNA synthetase
MIDDLAPTVRTVPRKADASTGLETRWMTAWDKESTYRFNRQATRTTVFSLDTPPPTVSGELHIGHVFSYTQSDLDRALLAHARQGRLLPHGLGRQRPAHRAPGRELLRGALRPPLPYDENFLAAREGGREEGQHLAQELRRALSPVDRTSTRRSSRRSGATSASASTGASSTRPSPSTQAISPAGLPRDARRGEVYSSEAPTLWDVDFRTAVSQAELEDRERPGNYHRIAFAEPTQRAPSRSRRRDRDAGQLRGAGRPPRRRALPGLFGTTSSRRSSASRCRSSPTSWPTPRRARASP